MSTIQFHIQRVTALLIALVGVMGMFALAAAPAQAQGQPPICEDYPDLEMCDDDDDDDDDDDGGEGDDVGPSGNGTGSGDADGSLPFTGYPLTGLILLLLILLAAGLALRGGTALHERFTRGSPS